MVKLPLVIRVYSTLTLRSEYLLVVDGNYSLFAHQSD